MANAGGAHIHQYNYTYQNAILYIGDTAAVVAAMTNGTWKPRLLQVDDKLNTKWDIPVDGNLFGVAKTPKLGLAFYTRYEKERNAPAPTILVYVLGVDLQSGEIAFDKLIMERQSDKHVEAKVLTGPDGTFQHVLIRVSNRRYHEKYNSNSGKWEGESIEFNLITSGGENFSERQILPIKTDGTDNMFDGAIANNQGDFFIVSSNNKNVVVEKFDRHGKAVDRLATNLTKLSTFGGFRLAINEQNDQSLLLLPPGTEGVSVNIFSFDFSRKKVLAVTAPADRAFFDNIMALPVNAQEQLKYKELKDLEPEGIIQHNGRIIAIREVLTSEEGKYPGSWATAKHTIIVSIYDQDLKVLTHIACKKEFLSYTLRKTSIGYTVRNNQLIIATNIGDLKNAQGAYIVIDLDTYKKETINTKSYTFEGSATCWFKNRFWIQSLINTEARFAEYTY